MKSFDEKLLVLKESFLNELYYNEKFNDDQLDEILSIIVSKTINNTSNLEMKFVRDIFFIYHKFNQALVSHFDVSDLYHITNYTASIRIYMDRLAFAIDRLLDGDINALHQYADELGKFKFI